MLLAVNTHHVVAWDEKVDEKERVSFSKCHFRRGFVEWATFFATIHLFYDHA
jgi:hypothetical protein